MKQGNSRQADVFAAYLAGLFDGEGNIGSGLRGGPSKTPWLKLAFSQSDLEFLQQIKREVYELFGVTTGKIQTQNPKYNRLTNNASHTLSFQGGKARRLAAEMLPYARVKQRHLQWIIHTWDNRMQPGGKLIDKEFFEQQHLNRPGRRAAATTKRKGTQHE